MIKKIINTLFSKTFSAIAGFLIIILVSHLLGTNGKGSQSIIAFNIYVFLLVFTLIGNSTLIYLAPRKSFSFLFIPSFIWIIFACFICFFLVIFINRLQSPFALQSIGIAFLASISEINYFYLMGKQQVIKANNLKLIFPISNILFILIFYSLNMFNDISFYVLSLWLSYSISLLYGVFLLRKDYLHLHFLSKQQLKQSFKILFSLGALKQLGSICQSLNYRVSFYIIAFFCGKDTLGVYSNSCSLCESVMLFGSALALVQYSHLSNNSNSSLAKHLTIRLTLFNALFSFLALALLCLLPQSFYVFLFGEGFADVGFFIRILAIGVLFLSCSSNFTQFFASQGNFSISFWASFIGLIVTIVLNLILVPSFNATGSAFAALCSYITTFAFEAFFFFKWTMKK